MKHLSNRILCMCVLVCVSVCEREREREEASKTNISYKKETSLLVTIVTKRKGFGIVTTNEAKMSNSNNLPTSDPGGSIKN